MKEKVLSNIINYLTINNLDSDFSDDMCVYFSLLEECEYNSLSDIVNKYSGNIRLSWSSVWKILDFTKTSVHLIESVIDAIRDEDYKSICYLKKEIIDNWELNEDIIVDKCRIFIDSVYDYSNDKGVSQNLKDEVINIKEIFESDKLNSITNIINHLESIRIGFYYQYGIDGFVSVLSGLDIDASILGLKILNIYE